ncbi:MAG: L-lactate dehydrogenase [candidate division BRC1 bacterium ADurb.BinA364]|nr:MAG: L-lactate dehydrogenase [candidate division BRC1 bacterium ADurb.BinA364]
MERHSWAKRRKVAVVGAGAVGSTFCYALAQSGLAEEIAVIDRNENLVRGQVLDLVHGQPYFPTVSIRVGDASDYADAQLIVITAGAAQRPGETRLQLLQKNAAIVRGIVDDIFARESAATIVIVSNPVDVLTAVAQKRAGGARGRIIGSGTVLDSARFRYLLSQRCGVDIHNVHAYILGEHGDSEFAAWSMTHVAGMPVDEYAQLFRPSEDWAAERRQIEREVRDSAYHIIEYKGATCFAIGMALVRIAGAILRAQRSVLTVSVALEGEFGLDDVCLSVPAVVSEGGMAKIVESALPDNEREALFASAAVLKQAMSQLDRDE